MTRQPTQTRVVSPTLHLSILLIITAFLAIGLISILFRVEVVAQGTGRIIPATRVQVLQTEFDGKITAIHINNGSLVKKGDVLIELDTTDSLGLVKTLIGETQRLQIEAQRIDTFIKSINLVNLDNTADESDSAVIFSAPHGLSAHPFFLQQRRLLDAEIASLQALLEQNTVKILANRKSVALTRAKIEQIETVLIIQQERLKVAQDLLDKGVSNRFAFVDVEEASIRLEGNLGIHISELEQKILGEKLLLAERRSLIASQLNRLQQRRAEIDSRLAGLREQLISARRRVTASHLTAPVEGIVDHLKIFTIGGVVKAGEELMHIVARNQEIEIEAMFPNNDVGFLQIGQQANIKLDAYPAARFGFVKGRLLDISADAYEMRDGSWGFMVRIKPDQPKLMQGSSAYDLKPGMTVAVDIITDDRRLISYFFAPIIQTIENSLGER